jgi:hypothetical protein
MRSNFPGTVNKKLNCLYLQLALNMLNKRLAFITPNFHLELFRMSSSRASGGCGLCKAASEVSFAL